MGNYCSCLSGETQSEKDPGKAPGEAPEDASEKLVISKNGHEENDPDTRKGEVKSTSKEIKYERGLDQPIPAARDSSTEASRMSKSVEHKAKPTNEHVSEKTPLLVDTEGARKGCDEQVISGNKQKSCKEGDITVDNKKTKSEKSENSKKGSLKRREVETQSKDEKARDIDSQRPDKIGPDNEITDEDSEPKVRKYEQGGKKGKNSKKGAMKRQPAMDDSNVEIDQKDIEHMPKQGHGKPERKINEPVGKIESESISAEVVKETKGQMESTEQKTSLQSHDLQVHNENIDKKAAVVENKKSLSPEKSIKSDQEYGPLVVSIDIGSTHSGYAYSIPIQKAAGKNQASKITLNKNWAEKRGYTSFKAPTALAKEDGRVHFGFEAFERYEELLDQMEDESDNNTREKFQFHQATYLGLEEGESRYSKVLLKETACYLIEHCIESIKRKVISIQSFKKLVVVLVVGNGWAKNTDQISTKEIESKARELSSLEVDIKVIDDAKAGWLFYRRQNYDVKQEAEAHKFMIISTGGSGINIHFYYDPPSAAQDDDSPKMKTQETAGSLSVDKHFIQSLKEVLGQDFINQLYEKSPSTWYSFLESFSNAKGITHPQMENGVILPLGYLFGSIFEEVKKIGLSSFLTEQAKESGFSVTKDGKLAITAEKMQSFYQELVDGFTSSLQEFKNDLKVHDNILLVGGMSESQWLRVIIQEELEGRLIIPENANMCAVKGGIASGYN